MTSTELRKLNMYPEWRDLQGYNNVFNYVQSIQNNQPPVFPAGLNARQRQRFQQKFGTDFRLVAQGQNPNAFDLVYRPALANNANAWRVSLTVVPPNQRQQILQGVFDDREAGYGMGINLFYARVCLHYLGINREECGAFLKSQGNYNVSRPTRNIVNKPILAKTSTERWGCDLIYMSRYYRKPGSVFDAPQFRANGTPYPRYKYILTVIDFFSGFVWAKPLVNKNNDTVIHALDGICTSIQPNTYPHILQCDNEHIFVNADFENWCDQHNITLIHTSSYNPSTNGKIERANETLRQKFKDGFIRNNNLQWVRYLSDYLQNMNSAKKKNTKFTAFELYTPGYNPPPNNLVNFHQEINDHSDAQDIQKLAQANLIRRAFKSLKRGLPPSVFRVGDRCRINIFKLSTEMRERYKNHRGIQFNAIRYTPDVFEVSNVFAVPQPNLDVLAPQGNVWDVVRERYNIRPVLANNQLGQVVSNDNGVPIDFFGSDLLKVPQQETPTNVPDRHRARQINRFIGLVGANNPNFQQPPHQPSEPPPPVPPVPPVPPRNIPALPNNNPQPRQNANARQPRQNQFLQGFQVEPQRVIPRQQPQPQQQQQNAIRNPDLEIRRRPPARNRRPSQLRGDL
jgi:transposase InsO family protein